MIRLFAGFDPREEVGYHVFCSSALKSTTEPVSFTPLHLPTLPHKGGTRDGTNAFIYSRFLIPYLCDYQGFAIFADACDMTIEGDLSDLWSLRQHRLAVQVVQHDYLTKHQRKYIGTPMESDNRDYPRKNWSSLMLINCAHPKWRRVDPEFVEKTSGADLHRFSFIPDEFIGALPIEWNWLPQEYGENAQAKLVHWTAGIPAFPFYADTPMADTWRAHARDVAQH